MNNGYSFYQKALNNINDGVYFVDTNMKITYWNQGAERLSGYTYNEVVGFKCQDNILTHVDHQGINQCKRFCPLKKTILDGQEREAKLFLHHKEGHRVPVLIRVFPVTDDQGQIIGGVEIFYDNSTTTAYSEQIEQLQKIAMFDPLTELANRRYSEMKLSTMLDELKNYGKPFGVLFIDVDLFKQVNDTYGHVVGDMMLKMVAKTMLNRLKSNNVLCRWGGDEFLALIPNVEAPELYAIARDIQGLVEQSSLTHEGRSIKVTLSIGATTALPEDNMESLIKRGDSLGYQCKAKGRNNVVLG